MKEVTSAHVFVFWIGTKSAQAVEYVIFVTELLSTAVRDFIELFVKGCSI